MTSHGMKLLLICVEHLTGWFLAYPIFFATASEVIACIKQHVIYSLRRPCLIVSEMVPAIYRQLAVEVSK